LRDKEPAVLSALARFDFALRRADDAAACIAPFLEFLKPWRIDTLAAGEIDLENRNMTAFFALAWPDDWARFYLSHRLHERDPIVSGLEFYDVAFTWSEMRRDKRFALAHDVLDRAREHGWTDGLVAPIPQGGARYGLVSLAGRGVELSASDKGVMSLMCIAFHQRVRVLAPRGGFPAPPLGLTERERECLQLIARGLSDRAIGEALGIAEVTARSYFEAAKTKLKARNRPQAIAKAVAWGVICE
jgi:LuxR family quorum-sensing system transcriptional regulator CciR